MDDPVLQVVGLIEEDDLTSLKELIPSVVPIDTRLEE
jgi:hypothetical protein